MKSITIILTGKLDLDLTKIGLKPGMKINGSYDEKNEAVYFEHTYNGFKNDCVVWKSNYMIMESESEKHISTNRFRYDPIAYVSKDWKEAWSIDELNEAIRITGGGKMVKVETGNDDDAMIITTNEDALARIEEDGLGIFLNTIGIAYWDKEKKDFLIVMSEDEKKVIYWQYGKGLDKVL